MVVEEEDLQIHFLCDPTAATQQQQRLRQPQSWMTLGYFGFYGPWEVAKFLVFQNWKLEQTTDCVLVFFALNCGLNVKEVYFAFRCWFGLMRMGK